MTDSKTVAVLVRARELLESGYVPRTPSPIGDETCAALATNTARYQLRLELEDEHAADLLVAKAAGIELDDADDTDPIMVWSDAGPKSKVIEGFTRAIELARAESAGAA